MNVYCVFQSLARSVHGDRSHEREHGGRGGGAQDWQAQPRTYI